MITCPYCKKEILNVVSTQEIGRLGGLKSRRKITPEQQAMMQEARRKKHHKEP